MTGRPDKPARGPRSPIWWFGGKGRMLAKLLPMLPPHEHYVEPFGGGASVLMGKPPCGGVETYNDLDGGLVNLFRVLADPEHFARFHRRVEALPYSRQLYREMRDACLAAESADAVEWVEWAVAFFYVARQSFSGMFGASWSSAVTHACRGVAETCSTWMSAIAALPAIHRRLASVQIEQGDGLGVLERYDGPGYLAYCDPPYAPETRRDGEYRQEMSAEDHERLCARLLAYRGAVVLSGYGTARYDPLDAAGWDRRVFETSCCAVGRTRATGILGAGAAMAAQRRVEVVWRNPEAMRRIEAADRPGGPLFAEGDG